ncbi:MAG TPA: phosphate ABC transporter substrate-binding protein [Anaerolineae bacterium]
MTLHRALRIVACGLVLSATGCNAVPTPRAIVRLTLVGDDSMQGIASGLANAYSQQHPNATITVRPADSDTGLRAATEFSSTIGMVSRTIKPAELAGERAVVVARDGIAIIVNRGNTINAIMRSQIAEVFSGQVSVWPTGPNAGKVIAVVSREAGSGTRDAFEAMAMNGAHVTLTAVVMPGEAAMVDYVAQHPEAIGYCAMSFLSDGVQAMTVDDIPLSPQTVENQKYPFVRTLAFIIPLSPEPAVQDFVDFALGSDGQRNIGQKNGRAP